MIVGIGVDTIEIERIAALWRRSRERFPARLFTRAEHELCASRDRPAESFAARFCAKEATFKCLGAGPFMGLGFPMVEVVLDARGAPGLRLHGAAAELAARLGVRRWHLSLTHTATTATAFVIAEG